MNACGAGPDPEAAPTANVTSTAADIPATMPIVTTTTLPPDRPIPTPATSPVSTAAPTEHTPETEQPPPQKATAPDRDVAGPGTDHIPQIRGFAKKPPPTPPKRAAVGPGTDHAPETTVAAPAPDDATVAVATTIPELSPSIDEVPLRVVQISQSVPLIETADSIRGGILINGGYIVTSVDPYVDSSGMSENTYWHYGVSVDPTYEFDRVLFPNGEEFKNVPLVGLVHLAGLAVLGPVDASTPPLKLNNRDDIVPGSLLYSIQYSPRKKIPKPIFPRGILLEKTTGGNPMEKSLISTDSAAYVGGPIVNKRGEILGIAVETSWTKEEDVYFISSSSAVPIVDGLIKECAVVDKWFHESEGVLPRLGEYISVLLSTTTWGDLTRSWIELDCQDEHGFDSLGSEYYESLHPGFLVLYSGTYSTPEEAQNTCWVLNRRTSDRCHVRRLSQDPADRGTVYPPQPR